MAYITENNIDMRVIVSIILQWRNHFRLKKIVEGFAIFALRFEI